MRKIVSPNGLWIGDFCKVPVYLDSSWFLLIGISAAFGGLHDVLIYLALFGIVLLHEFGHVSMGMLLGVPTKEVRLFLFGGAASMNVPSNSKEFPIAVAGPAVNVILAYPLYSISHYSEFWFTIFAINIVVFVFNLLPAFPLDGGRIFRSIVFCFTQNSYTSTLVAVRVSQTICVLLGILALCFLKFIIAFICVIIFFAAGAELLREKRECNAFQEAIDQIDKQFEAYERKKLRRLVESED